MKNNFNKPVEPEVVEEETSEADILSYQLWLDTKQSEFSYEVVQHNAAIMDIISATTPLASSKTFPACVEFANAILIDCLKNLKVPQKG